MRDAWVNTPLLLLLLLVLASLTRTAISQDDEGAKNVENAEKVLDLTSDNTESQEDGGDLTTQSETEIPMESTSVQDEDQAGSTQNLPDDASTRSPTTLDQASSSTTEGSADGATSREDASPEEPEDSSLMLILIPVVIVTLICMVVCGYFIIRKWKQNVTKRESVKEDQFLDECSTEKVPMPMFEEDVPSVLELEMEDFDQWITKDC